MRLAGTITPVILVGNKSDYTVRAVDEVEGSALASELNTLFYEASAKTNHNVDVVFRKIAELAYVAQVMAEMDMAKSPDASSLQPGHQVASTNTGNKVTRKPTCSVC